RARVCCLERSTTRFNNRLGADRSGGNGAVTCCWPACSQFTAPTGQRRRLLFPPRQLCAARDRDSARDPRPCALLRAKLRRCAVYLHAVLAGPARPAGPTLPASRACQWWQAALRTETPARASAPDTSPAAASGRRPRL